MTLPPDTLVIRGGTMTRKSVEENIAACVKEYGRNGFCLMARIDDAQNLAGDGLVPHAKLCLTTPALLKEEGTEPDIESTNDLGNRHQHPLWLPEGDPGSLVEPLWRAFRGP